MKDGGGEVYVSFSGGKDSTVLLSLVRKIYPNIKAVFSDTGLEFPEIREFVKTFDNVDWVTPKKYNKEKKSWERCNFVDVIRDFGYPIISKEVSRDLSAARNSPNGKTAQKFDPNSQYTKKYGKTWCLERYKYLLDAPFKISNKCCSIMKKNPLHNYNKETGLHPYLGIMAEESQLRKKTWLDLGCNAFEAENPQSLPMAFWTEQDVLQYIQRNNIKVSSVYGDLKTKDNGELFFTGRERTGCVFCMYGCQRDKSPNRFQQLKISHPNLYNYCMRGGKYDEDGFWVPDKGLGMDKVLKYIGVETDYEEPKGDD